MLLGEITAACLSGTEKSASFGVLGYAATNARKRYSRVLRSGVLDESDQAINLTCRQSKQPRRGKGANQLPGP